MNSLSKPIRAQRDKRNAPPVPPDDWAGKPLRDVLWLLLLPALFLATLFGFDWQPGSIVLYGFTAIFGVLVLASLRKGPEALLAVAIMYMPLSRLYVARFAPGINGTNALELFMIAVWVLSSISSGRKMFAPFPFARMVTVWLLFTLGSLGTAIANIGFSPFVWNYGDAVRGFLDQFIVFFLFVNLIRDKNMARRLVIYMMIAACASYLYGFKEWFGTRGLSNIEKSRLLGPIGQPNEYAAFILYSVAPILAFGAFYFPRWKSIRLVPIGLIALRVLLGTFSRAAYLGLGVEVLVVSFVKSRKFFVMVMLALAGVYFFIPSLVPNSMKARVAQTYEDRTAGGDYDRSAEERLLLWNAALAMTAESPFFGKGFDRFRSLAPEYVAEPTKATDNQNMFLFVTSNMGVPALISLMTIVLAFALRGWSLYRNAEAEIDRVIGLGAVTMVGGLLVVNMFGTHMLDSSVDGFFWVYLAVLAHLWSPKRRDNDNPRAGRGKERVPRARQVP